MVELSVPYNGLALDRAGAARADPAWVRGVAEHPDAVVIPLWRDGCLVRGERAHTVPYAEAAAVLAEGQVAFLGHDGGAGVFAVDLSALAEADAVGLVGAGGVGDVRALFPTLTAQRAAILAYARGILHWNRNQLFCGVCGGGTDSRHAGHLRVCVECGKWLFPRIEPAVIVLVRAPGTPARCLLARHRGAAERAYSTLAGFVEIGEGLEDAVRREVAEEAGVRLRSVRYLASQAWPFPSGLMIGFHAVAEDDAVVVDRRELVDARWFTHQEVRELIAEHRAGGTYRGDSIEQALIEAWLAGD